MAIPVAWLKSSPAIAGAVPGPAEAKFRPSGCSCPYFTRPATSFTGMRLDTTMMVGESATMPMGVKSLTGS
ncbi:hypothetical protein D3C87_1686070 [compost metagenome]